MEMRTSVRSLVPVHPDRDPVEEADPRHTETVRTAADGVFKARAAARLPPRPLGSRNTRYGPAIVAELRGGAPDVSAERLTTIVQPTLLVAGKDSPPWVAEPTKLMAAAMPSAKVEWIESGHLVNPVHPVVLAFVDEVLARR
jgi:pimeloyl-ACP methyl ester carboxylesterase